MTGGWTGTDPAIAWADWYIQMLENVNSNNRINNGGLRLFIVRRF